jgi:hypothetical protein
VLMRTHTLAAVGLLLLATFGGTVIAAEQQYSCKGQMIAPSGEPQESVNVNLNLGGRDKTTIELGGEIAPEVTGHGLPLSKCEAYKRVYDQPYGSS